MGNIGKNKIDIICHKCPLIPIISITLTKEGTLICEYRCPSFHMGFIRFEEVFSNKNNIKYGCKCFFCHAEIEDVPDEEKYKFCGFCQKFICNSCLIEHKKLYSNHNILDYSKINAVCLYHGENYKYYCFTCLRSICPKCFLGHDKHCFKLLNEMGQNEITLNSLNNSFNEVYDFLNIIKKSKYTYIDRKQYNIYEKRNITLLNFIKDLYKIYIQKKEENALNGEIIINLLNLSKFNFNSKLYYSDPNLFFKSHLIISNTPVSSICSFTNAKIGYKVSKLSPVLFKDLKLKKEVYTSLIISRMDYDLIAYNIGNILYFMKNEEKIFFKVDIKKKINNYYQLKQHIICIYSGKDFYFYKLINLEPYIISFSVLMPNSINNVIQVYGCIFTELYIIDKNNNIYKLKQIKSKPNSKYNLSLEIEKKVKLKSHKKDTKNNNILILNKNKSNDIKLCVIKGIGNNFLVMRENNLITLVNKKDLSQVEKYLEAPEKDFIIYNSHILLPELNEIIFYSIPKLNKVSIVKVSENINSLLIPNKNMLLVVGESSIEQFELNTWKKISKLNGIKNFDLGENSFFDSTLIGNTNELYLFISGLIYKFKSN